MPTPGTLEFPGALDTVVSLLETSNKKSSTLTGAISSSATSLTLLSATGWPSTGAGSIQNERIFWIGKTGNQLTGLLRGQDGSTAVSHAAGSVFQMTVQSRHHQILSEAIRAIEAKLGIGATTPDTIGYGLRVIAPGETAWIPIAGSGTVTSVGLSLPSVFSVSGSPVVTSGTLAATLAVQSANRVFAGPSTGADAAPTFRALVAADIPSLSYQPLDADLTALAGLASAADKLPYFTGLGTASLATFTAAGRALVDDADATAQRTTLGLGTLATQSGTFSGTSSGTNTGDQTPTSLGLLIGTNTQAWDADLDAIAALAGTSGLLKKTAANTWSLDTSTYLTGNQTVTLSGDISGSGATSITTTIGAGVVTSAMLAGSIAASKLVGTDITTVGTLVAGSVPTSLITGLGSLAALNAAPAGTLTGATLASGVTASSLTSFGVSPAIATPSFTTGFTIGGAAATGAIPRGNGTNFVASAFTMAVPGTSGNVLTSDGTNWLSSTPAGGGGLPTGLSFSSPDFTVASAAANQAVLSGSTTTNPVKLVATGSDTNIGITLTPKGSSARVIVTDTSGAGSAALAFSSASTVGFNQFGTGWLFYGGGGVGFPIQLTSGVKVHSGGFFGFTNSSGDASAATNTALWLLSPGLVGVGGSSSGFTGSLKLTNLISDGVVRLKGYTVGTLPAGTTGDTAYVTDALTPAFLVAVVGGGSTVTTVFFNGTSWIAQ